MFLCEDDSSFFQTGGFNHQRSSSEWKEYMAKTACCEWLRCSCTQCPPWIRCKRKHPQEHRRVSLFTLINPSKKARGISCQQDFTQEQLGRLFLQSRIGGELHLSCLQHDLPVFRFGDTTESPDVVIWWSTFTRSSRGVSAQSPGTGWLFSTGLRRCAKPQTSKCADLRSNKWKLSHFQYEH